MRHNRLSIPEADDQKPFAAGIGFLFEGIRFDRRGVSLIPRARESWFE
jgi:hypothetical protein